MSLSKISSFFPLMLTVVMKCHPVLKMNVQRKIRKICYHHLKKETRRSVKVRKSDDMDSGKDEAVIGRDCGLRFCVNENTQRKELLDRFDVLSL